MASASGTLYMRNWVFNQTWLLAMTRPPHPRSMSIPSLVPDLLPTPHLAAQIGLSLSGTSWTVLISKKLCAEVLLILAQMVKPATSIIATMYQSRRLLSILLSDTVLVSNVFYRRLKARIHD